MRRCRRLPRCSPSSRVWPPSRGEGGTRAVHLDLAQEGTATKTSEQIKREVFTLGASLSGTAGQDASTFQMRGLNNTLPQMLAILADVVATRVSRRPSSSSESEYGAAAPGANRLAQYVNNKLFRQTLFGTHPYARDRRDAGDAAGDRSPVDRLVPTDLLPSEQRLPRRGWRCRADAVFAAAEQAFGGWERRAFPEAKPPPMPALKGRTLVFVQRPNSVQSSISVGNFTPSATIRGGTRCSLPTRFRRRVRLAAGQQHPRREGLHLLAAVDLPVHGGRAACIAPSPMCATTSPARR